MSEWDDYNETLTQVLTWLIQAETQLKQQEAISQDVDLVKEQFREHEVFFILCKKIYINTKFCIKKHLLYENFRNKVLLYQDHFIFAFFYYS